MSDNEYPGVATCTHPPHKFIHIDMDAYFVAVELLDDPSLATRPVAVGGSAAERGVISTANYIARQSGVRSGMATATAQRLCPGLVRLPVRLARYEAVTQQLDGIFRRYTDRVEFFSLDEASLDVTGLPHCDGSATRMAVALRQAIRVELGLTASAGVAPLKYLAKIASEVNKPDGLHVITPHEVPTFLATLDLRKLPGVGPRAWAVLERIGCRRCGDVDVSKLPALLRELGVQGYQLWALCQGMEPAPRPPGSIRSLGVEHTLATDCVDFEACTLALLALMPALHARLSTLEPGEQVIRNQIKLKFDDFAIASTEAPATVIDERVLRSLLLQLWNGRRQGRAVRLIGAAVKVRRADAQDRQLSLCW
ncbi:DNA polymerase IV [Pseudomonas sp. MLB6B]